MTTITLCYRKERPTAKFIFRRYEPAPGIVVYAGLPDPYISKVIRGEQYGKIEELAIKLGKTAVDAVKNGTFPQMLYIVNDDGSISNVTLYDKLKETKQLINPKLNSAETKEEMEKEEEEESTTIKNKNKNREFDLALNILGLENPILAVPESSLQYYEDLEEPDDYSIKLINKYDEKLTIQYPWASGELNDMSWLKKKNSSWNPVLSCFALVYYIFKDLKWPLEEIRFVLTYDVPALNFMNVIASVYKTYNITEWLQDSDIVTKIVVWMIASTNSFGVIRPIMFQRTSTNISELAKIVCLSQKHDQVQYVWTWPIRIDSKHVYVLKNNKIETFSIDVFMKDKKKKTIVKLAPDWIYDLVK